MPFLRVLLILFHSVRLLRHLADSGSSSNFRVIVAAPNHHKGRWIVFRGGHSSTLCSYMSRWSRLNDFKVLNSWCVKNKVPIVELPNFTRVSWLQSQTICSDPNQMIFSFCSFLPQFCLINQSPDEEATFMIVSTQYLLLFSTWWLLIFFKPGYSKPQTTFNSFQYLVQRMPVESPMWLSSE